MRNLNISQLGFVILTTFIFSTFKLNAQSIGVGEWKSHLPYHNAIAVTEGHEKIYCAGESAVFYYDLNDNSINPIAKETGLSDVGINTIAYSKDFYLLLIGYENGNIDIIENNNITNLSDIKREQIVGAKSINNILFIDSQAWMACSFGIVILELTSKKFVANWVIGPDGSNVEVYDLAFDGTNIFAATEDGIFIADMNAVNIQDFNYWYQVAELPVGEYNEIEFFNNKIYTNFYGGWGKDTLFVYDTLGWRYANMEFLDSTNNEQRYSIDATENYLLVTNYYKVTGYDKEENRILQTGSYAANKSPLASTVTSDGTVWIADNENGLVKFKNGSYDLIYPSGPGSSNVFDIDIEGSVVWVAPGGVSPQWNNTWNQDGIFFMEDYSWSTIDKTTISELDTMRDMIAVKVDPSNPQKAFVGTWWKGLLEFSTTGLENIYSYYNSTLTHSDDQNCNSYCAVNISDMEFDTEGDLWVLNPLAENSLSVKTASGNWYNFSPDNTLEDYITSQILIDDYDQKWIVVPDKGIVVFDEGDTYETSSDDRSRWVKKTTGNGGLPTNSVLCVASDSDGAIWVGTKEGIGIFNYPYEIFEDDASDAYRPIVGSFYLLEFESVTTIAVDGANRKWVGTDGSGVFLISENGDEELLHYTSNNSPLLSDVIRDIAIDQITGEVFFGTDKGLISYKSTATEGTIVYDEVFVYPNPVRPDFEGTIAIRGLVTNSIVKITDIAGNLIYEAIADGGQATWDGKNFSGEKARTGVYLIFASDSNGEETIVTKLLMMN